MKLWKMLVAIPIGLVSSQAFAKNWVVVATDKDGFSTSVDKDSIQGGDYGFRYFIDYDDPSDEPQDMAVDCQKRVIYFVKVVLDGNGPDWRDSGQVVEPGTVGEAELNYVCANAR